MYNRNSYDKKYTPKYDYDLINKKYLDETINKIFGVGFIYIGSDPSVLLNGSWEKIENITVGSKTVDGWIRIK